MLGRCCQQGLDGADSRCLDEVDGASFADAEPAGCRDAMHTRLQDALARLRGRRVQHPFGVAEEAEESRVGDAEVDLHLPAEREVVERIDLLR